MKVEKAKQEPKKEIAQPPKEPDPPKIEIKIPEPKHEPNQTQNQEDEYYSDDEPTPPPQRNIAHNTAPNPYYYPAPRRARPRDYINFNRW
ncbi:hypothetical protein TRFO_41594 [Tritrichomonas foetus]|uniref:Uncharacterized protein n=1 Tax=Tritrichomonas foetus TaxID=1144522 RepID=A0A1J4KZT1_9EUKA|nr:hypothetical protein TRFO_41594 [Tritrichomonas foetus]|eukprot:OHT16759.1 hypothetical protein TRFO_41594 [Tritrichomonas foetus]